jgi:hypothetical protein
MQANAVTITTTYRFIPSVSSRQGPAQCPAKGFGLQTA